MNTIFDDWKVYERDVIPADAGSTQREECRRAFYAGAATMFSLMNEATMPDNEATCVDNLEALHQEILAMTYDLKG